VYANYSTISGNVGVDGAAIQADKVYLGATTVFDNHSIGADGSDGGFVGGVYPGTVGFISNCTIVGNTSGVLAAGLFSLSNMTVQSSIIFGNKTGGIELDIGGSAGSTLGGQNNLIGVHQADLSVPGETLSADPKLGPLQDNGGPTRTLALLAGSPAIDKGNNHDGFLSDQRLFPRLIGGKADIGAFEFDPDHIFGNGFNL
jgi:hypothetical protein